MATIEIFLILFVLVLFILTDARTVKMIADESLSSTKFTYNSIEGNFITGLEIKNLAYDKKTLANSATLHWNPISLMYKKITLTQLDVKGVDIEHITEMINGFEKKKGSSFSLPLNLSAKHIHVDINPYVYAGVKFDSFLFESDKIEVDTDMLVDADKLYLSFNSDIVNVKLKGNIDKNRVLLKNVKLKEIDTKAIASLVKKIGKTNTSKEKRAKSKSIVKEIKINHISAKMKDVTYGSFSISGVKLFINHAVINPNTYKYKAKKVDFKGDTTYGSVQYKGYIKESNIYAKGKVLLSKKLFSMYHLPLNYNNLRELPGTLHLNHQGLWIEVEHNVDNLLKLETDFNIDVTKAKHTIGYVYRDKKVIIESNLQANMSYGDNVNIESKVLIDIAKKGYTTYSGNVAIPKVKNLPKELTNYLLDNVKAEYQGDKDTLMVNLDSKLIEGTFSTTYTNKSAVLKLKSKEKNIALKQIVSTLPYELENEFLALDSESFLDFTNIQNSKINLKIYSDLLNLNTTMRLSKPYKILFTADVPPYSRLVKLNKSIKFNHIKNISGELLIDNSIYSVSIQSNNDLKLSLKYNGETKLLNRGHIVLGGEEISFSNINSEDVKFNLNINNLKNLLSTVERYYDITLPKLEGHADITVIKSQEGLLRFSVKTPRLKYLSEKELSIEDINLNFTLDTKGNIVIDKYHFRVDNNPYFRDYYTDKTSYMNLKNGNLTISKLWLNNIALVEGNYNLDTANGDFTISSKNFPFINRDFDLLLDIDATLKVRKEKLAVDGVVNILGNSVHYDIGGSGIVEDSDIIIVQEQKEKRESVLKNLKLYLKIKSEKPLKYYGKDTRIEFYNDLSVVKEYKSDFMVTGMSTVTKGYYEMENKRFSLNESHLYFAGDPKKPLLDIKADYVKNEYVIHVFISGSVDEPIVNFSADPYLSQQEILSLILFDGTGSGQGADAYTLLGGTFAKGLIKSLGINVDLDHLLLGTDSNDDLSLEIGHKISKDITFMYMYKNGESGVKVRAKHNKKYETDIIIMPSASSIEFLYQKDH